MHELDPDFQQFGQSNDWESIRTWRREQRTRLIAQRKSLNSGERDRLREAVFEVLECESKFLGGCIGFYWPLDGEIDLRPLMHKLADRGAKLALPVIVEKDQPMEFWVWDTETRMQNQPIWNIPVPIVRKLIVPSVLFVPLLGFDKQGHRLGHGGGYYDRTLAVLEPKPLTVGVGYEFGRLETIYPQDHDVLMDVIVTEQGIVPNNG
jgi:5-formyltetrahydrofolate cyclo-ligase